MPFFNPGQNTAVDANAECLFMATYGHVCVFWADVWKLQTHSFQVQLLLISNSSLILFRSEIQLLMITDSIITHFRLKHHSLPNNYHSLPNNYHSLQIWDSITSSYHSFQVHLSVIQVHLSLISGSSLAHFRFITCSFQVHLLLISGSSLSHFRFITRSFQVHLSLISGSSLTCRFVVPDKKQPFLPFSHKHNTWMYCYLWQTTILKVFVSNIKNHSYFVCVQLCFLLISVHEASEICLYVNIMTMPPARIYPHIWT